MSSDAGMKSSFSRVLFRRSKDTEERRCGVRLAQDVRAGVTHERDRM